MSSAVPPTRPGVVVLSRARQGSRNRLSVASYETVDEEVDAGMSSTSTPPPPARPAMGRKRYSMPASVPSVSSPGNAPGMTRTNSFQSFSSGSGSGSGWQATRTPSVGQEDVSRSAGEHRSVPQSEEERQRWKERRHKTALELRDTERRYLDVLNQIDVLFYRPILSSLPPSPLSLQRRTSASSTPASTTTPPILSRQDAVVIFSNFENVLDLARIMAQTLDSCIPDYADPEPQSKESAVEEARLKLEGKQPPRTDGLLPFPSSSSSSGPSIVIQERSSSRRRQLMSERRRTTTSLLPPRPGSPLPFPSSSLPPAGEVPEPKELGKKLLPLLPFLKSYALFVSRFEAGLARLTALERVPSASGQKPSPGPRRRDENQSAAAAAAGAQARPKEPETPEERWVAFLNSRKAVPLPSASAAPATPGEQQGTPASSLMDLGLGNMLLGIVLRVPRYRLLLKDLVRFTEPDHPDLGELEKCWKVVDDVANHLESYIKAQTHTLSLVDLQKCFQFPVPPTSVPAPAGATSSNPSSVPMLRQGSESAFRLVSPGRKLVKFGKVTKVDRRGTLRERVFFIFSDVIVIASTGAASSAQEGENPSTVERGDGLGWARGLASAGEDQLLISGGGWARKSKKSSTLPVPVPMNRRNSGGGGRSMSMSGLGMGLVRSWSASFERSPSMERDGSDQGHLPSLAERSSIGLGEGGAGEYILNRVLPLEDVTVVLARRPPGRSGANTAQPVQVDATADCGFDIISPDKSFAVFAYSSEGRTQWIDAIREAKATLIQDRRTLKTGGSRIFSMPETPRHTLQQDTTSYSRDRRVSMPTPSLTSTSTLSLVSTSSSDSSAAPATPASMKGIDITIGLPPSLVTLPLPTPDMKRLHVSSPPSLGFIPPTPGDDFERALLGSELASSNSSARTSVPAERPNVTVVTSIQSDRPASMCSYASSSQPSQEELPTPGSSGISRREMSSGQQSYPVIENYIAPIWVPDSKTDKCMRCKALFGVVWTRRHHCRLCGIVCCWSCSQRMFIIPSKNAEVPDRLARACDSCYDSVFNFDTPISPSVYRAGAGTRHFSSEPTEIWTSSPRSMSPLGTSEISLPPFHLPQDEASFDHANSSLNKSTSSSQSQGDTASILSSAGSGAQTARPKRVIYDQLPDSPSPPQDEEPPSVPQDQPDYFSPRPQRRKVTSIMGGRAGSAKEHLANLLAR